MFHLHFHFAESSIADWLQALAAIIGIPFLIFNLKETNKNNKLQIDAFRNSIRPWFTFVSHNVVADVFPYNVFRCRQQSIVLKVAQNDVRNIVITALNTEHLHFQEEEIISSLLKDEELKIDYAVMSNAFILKDGQPKSLKIIYQLNVTIEYTDHAGFKYSQSLTGHPNFDLQLSAPKFI